MGWEGWKGATSPRPLFIFIPSSFQVSQAKFLLSFSLPLSLPICPKAKSKKASELKQKNLSFKVSNTFKNTTIKSTTILNLFVLSLFFFHYRNKSQTIFIHLDPLFFFLCLLRIWTMSTINIRTRLFLKFYAKYNRVYVE